MNTILALDFGSVNTRALLFEKVDGVYRLAAQAKGGATSPAPGQRLPSGLAAILNAVSESTGRRLIDEDGRVIRPERAGRAGVDYFLTTASAGPALRAVLMGLYPQVSIVAARRALAPFYIEPVAEIHLEDGLGSKARLNRIIHCRPQLIFITGGTDGGARTVMMEMLALAREAASLMAPSQRPAILYAGNHSLAPAAREMMGQMTHVMIAPNIRQRGGEALEPAQAALAMYFDETKRREERFRWSGSMSDSGIVPTARGVETMTSFFARVYGCGALTVDYGSARTMLALAREGDIQVVIRNDVGAGHSAAAALALIGEAEIAKWLPFQPRAGELAQYARNKTKRSDSVPLDMRERTIEFAFLRAGIRVVSSELDQLDASSIGLIVTRGATIAAGGQGALDLLLLADALDLEGVVRVIADVHGALPALGTLAAAQPTAVVQLVNGGALEDVGALVCVSGEAPLGSTAVQVQIKRGAGDSFAHEIAAGDVWHLPLAASEAVELRIQTRRGLSIGGKRRLRIEARGGRGGLLIDARLGAQAKATKLTERAVNMLRWYAAAAGQAGPVAIPEDWLASPK